MKPWLRRVRGALGMGVTWAIAWAVVGGGLMEGIFDRHGEILDMWPQTLAIPGFLGGVAFSVLLTLTAGRRRFHELSFARFATWGAAVGVVLGGLAVATGAAGNVFPFWWRAAMIIAPVTVLSAISSTGALALARVAARREVLGAPEADAALAPPAIAVRERLERPR